MTKRLLHFFFWWRHEWRREGTDLVCVLCGASMDVWR